MKKIYFLAIVFGTFATNVHAQTKHKAPAKRVTSPIKTTVFKNLNASFSYAAGMNIAESMQAQGITTLNQPLMLKAMQDVFNKKQLLLTPQQANMTLQEQLQIFAKKKADEQKKKNDAFLNANKLRKNVITLPDGLQYEVLAPGDSTGPKPLATDTVVVDYTGALMDGTEFNNSMKSGGPATFRVDRVIPAWTEALKLMNKGAHWKLFVPSELAYGARGNGPQIPPNSVLVFEVTLREIKPGPKE